MSCAVVLFSIGGENAKLRPAEMGTKKAGTGTTSRSIIQAIRDLQPSKAWGYLADMLSMTERSARHRINATREFSPDEIAALLRTEDGYLFLAAMMQGSAPLWWRICSPLMEATDAERMKRAANRKLARAFKKAVDDERDLDLTMERGRMALMLQDEDFHRPHLAGEHEHRGAGRSAGGFLAGAMAQAKKR